MPQTRRPWRGVAPDIRQEARRERLLDAGFEVLATQGWEATTVRAVCAQAELTSRYFYESFADLDTLLITMFDRLLAQLTTRAATAAAETDGELRDRVRAFMDAAIRFITEDPRRIRVLAVEAIANERLNRRRLDALYQLARLADRHGQRLYGSPRPGDEIGRMASHILVGGLAELGLAWLDGEFNTPIDQLADDLTDLAIGFAQMTADLARHRRRGPTTQKPRATRTR
jgi:AcrR family transcriptional regulator